MEEMNKKDRAAQAVRLRMTPGAAMNVRVRFVGAGNALSKLPQPGCQPRKDGVRQDKNAEVLPAATLKKLLAANAVMVGWLARSPENAARFMEAPFDALKEAGVKLEREDLKAIARRQAVSVEEAHVPPGLRIGKVEVVGDPTARIKPTVAKDDCDCAHK